MEAHEFTWVCPLCLSLKPTLLIYLPKLSSLMGHSPCPTLVLHLWGHLALNLLLLLPTPYPVFLHNLLFPFFFLFFFYSHSYHSPYHYFFIFPCPYKTYLPTLASHLKSYHHHHHHHHLSSYLRTKRRTDQPATSLYFSVQLLNKKPLAILAYRLFWIIDSTRKRWKAVSPMRPIST